MDKSNLLILEAVSEIITSPDRPLALPPVRHAPGRGRVDAMLRDVSPRSQAVILIRPAARHVQSQTLSRRQRQQPPKLRCVV